MAVWFQFRVRVGPKFSSERERLYNNAMRKRKSFLCYAILRKAQQKRRLFQVNSLCERNSHAILNTLPTAIPMLITQKPVRKRLTDKKNAVFFPVLTTCKTISKGLASRFVYWSCALREKPQINGLEKKQKHGGRRQDCFSLLYFVIHKFIDFMSLFRHSV